MSMSRTKLAALTATIIVAGSFSASTAFAESPVDGLDLTKSCKIGFSQGTMNHPWRVAMVEGNKSWAEANLPNVELIITDGQNESAKQVADVESLLAQNIDVLMISPLTQQALTPIVKDAIAAGIPVVEMDRKVNTDTTVYISAENEPIGRQAGEFFAQTLGGKGNIVVIEGTAGASAAIERQAGFEEAIAKYPDLKIVARQNADFLREGAAKFMEDALQRFGPGKIDGVFTHNDEMALGALTAIEAAGRQDEIMLTGVDGQNNAIQAVKDGKLFATFTFPWVAPEGIQYAYRICAGGEIANKFVKLDSHTITADNADDWIGKGF